MSFTVLRRKIVAAIALTSMAFASCGSLSSVVGLPPALTDTLGQVTGLTSNIAGWKSSLPGVLDQTGLGQLGDYAAQAGNLGNQVMGFTDKLSSAAADPLGAIGAKLSEMGSLDVAGLRNLGPADQQRTVDGFTGSASRVGSMVEDFLGKFS